MSWIYKISTLGSRLWPRNCHTIPGDEGMAGSSWASNQLQIFSWHWQHPRMWDLKRSEKLQKIPPFLGMNVTSLCIKQLLWELLQKKLAAPMNRCYKLNFECSYMVYQRWTSECMASQSIQFHTNCWLTTPLILVGTPTFLHLTFGQSRSGWVPQLSFYLTNVFLWIGNIHIPTVCG